MAQRDVFEDRINGCPVCGTTIRSYWGGANLVRSGEACSCGLYAYRLEPKEDANAARTVGDILRHVMYFTVVVRYGYWEGPPPFPEGRTMLVDEARRLLAHDERAARQPAGDNEHTARVVYADWLDENDFPLNAEAVRTRHGRRLWTG